MIRFILISNDPRLARRAEAAGVERLFVDLEQIGKQQRQGHLDTLISSHVIDDIPVIRAVLEKAELMVRTNPLHPGSRREIDAVIGAGAQLLMLPMFRSASEVAEFCRMVDGRVPVVPLVETVGAVNCLSEVVAIPGVSEIYIGLNDLHLEMKLEFMFELLADGLVDDLVEIVAKAGLPFGFGGVAKAGEGIVPGELVMAEHARLGSSTVILSRTFHRGVAEGDAAALAVEVAKLKSAYCSALARNPQQIASDREHLVTTIRDFVRAKKR